VTTLSSYCAASTVASALPASAIEGVSQRKRAFAGLRAEKGSEAEVADQNGYMTAFS
jgi:hypothetical protein